MAVAAPEVAGDEGVVGRRVHVPPEVTASMTPSMSSTLAPIISVR